MTSIMSLLQFYIIKGSHTIALGKQSYTELLPLSEALGAIILTVNKEFHVHFLVLQADCSPRVPHVQLTLSIFLLGQESQ
jgi:hypothetical protein